MQKFRASSVDAPIYSFSTQIASQFLAPISSEPRFHWNKVAQYLMIVYSAQFGTVSCTVFRAIQKIIANKTVLWKENDSKVKNFTKLLVQIAEKQLSIAVFSRRFCNTVPASYSCKIYFVRPQASH